MYALNTYYFTHHELNGPDSVVCKDMLLHNGHVDNEWTVSLTIPTFSKASTARTSSSCPP